MVRDYDALDAFLGERRAMPFDWASNDCVRFGAAAIAAQTGWNPLEGVGRWKSASGAARAIAAHGGLEAAVSGRLARIAPAMAKRGDIAGVRDDAFGVRLMVVEGQTLVAPGDAGLVRCPRQMMIMAWSAERSEAVQ